MDVHDAVERNRLMKEREHDEFKEKVLEKHKK